MNERASSFWGTPAPDLLQDLQTTPKGLDGEQARARFARYGPNLLRPKKKLDVLSLFLAQFASPISLILLFAAALVFFLQDQTDALIILGIVFVSGFLSFWQERGAAGAVEKLLALVRTSAMVLRDGAPQDIPFEEVVPGDVVVLSAGDEIPADCLILEEKDLFVDEAALTGETYPVEKTVGVLPGEHAARQTDQRPLSRYPRGQWDGACVGGMHRQQ